MAPAIWYEMRLYYFKEAQNTKLFSYVKECSISSKQSCIIISGTTFLLTLFKSYEELYKDW